MSLICTHQGRDISDMPHSRTSHVREPLSLKEDTKDTEDIKNKLTEIKVIIQNQNYKLELGSPCYKPSIWSP